MLFVCAPHACDYIGSNRLCVRSQRTPVSVNYFAQYLTVMVKIHTLGSNVAVMLAGYLVWWDSP